MNFLGTADDQPLELKVNTGSLAAFHESYVREMLRRVERIELAGPVAHLASNFVAGIKHMPVRMTPRSGARLSGEAPERLWAGLTERSP